MTLPKVSIVTVSFNSEKTIRNSIISVKNQTYENYEHIVVDGLSTDNTIAILETERHPNLSFKSEKDLGIYDAMNKGFLRSNGEFVAFLNSDDVYFDENVFEVVVQAFSDKGVDFVYGNLEVRDPEGNVLRVWKPKELDERGLVSSQIPHPCIFIRKSILDKIKPPFDSDLKISADIKQQLILINKMKSKGKYLNQTLAIMSNGGASTNSLSSYFLGWKETMNAYNEIFGSGGLKFTIRKILSKFSGVKRLSLITKR